ncbi:MAG: hydantoinase B/oxoprolinase family protein [Alphaproteobacteria bacterium]
MSDKGPLATSVSLDDLLRSSRDAFDNILRRSTTGEPAPAPAARESAPDAPASTTTTQPRAAETAPTPSPARRAAPTTVQLDVLGKALGNIRDEMDSILRRRAASAALHERHGEAPILADAQGRMVAGEFGGAVAAAIRGARRGGVHPGDVLLVADPYGAEGTVSSLNEWLLVVPAFLDDDLVGYAAILGQMQADHAGAVTSIRDEGLRIPPLKLVERGTTMQAVLDLVAVNAAEPAVRHADLMAMLAAARLGERRLAELARRFGAGRLRDGLTALLARSGRQIAKRIQALLPPEPRTFHDHIDADGLRNGPFRLKLTVWREGERGFFDWTGSAAQAAGPANLMLSPGLFKTYVARYLLGSADPSVGFNDGHVEQIDVTLPRGSILRPRQPAPLGGGRQALARQFEVLVGALSRGAPETAAAGGYGGAAQFEFAGTDRDGEPFHLVDAVLGGLAGRPAGDGADGHAWWPRQDAASTEDIESAWPVLVERHTTLADSGGPGQHRGGHGVEKIYRVLADGLVTLHDDREITPAWGNNGGQAGQHAGKWLQRKDGGRETLPPNAARVSVKTGDRIIFRTAGGGGWGDPLARDPAAVRDDVARRLVSAQAAREHYGVVVSGPTATLDRGATEALREQLRRRRPTPPSADHGQRREAGGDGGTSG